MIDPYLLSVIIFFSFLAVLIYRDRKNIDFTYILMMRRTKRFRNILDRIAKKSPLFWKVIGTIAFFICLLFMVEGIRLLLITDYLVFTGVIKEPGVSIAIPFPSEHMISGPGFIGVPFWFYIIIVASILIPHESFHGIVARAEKVKLKSVGLFLFAILPGAFVEPDEKQFKKSKLMTKLRILSVGSFINIVIGLTLMFLIQNLLWAPNVNGLLITSVNETSPAGKLGLSSGMVLESIDGKDMNIGFYDYSFLVLMVPKSNTENITKYISLVLLRSVLREYDPGDTVKLKISGINYDLKLGEHPEVEGYPYIGITSQANTKNVNFFLVLFPLLSMISFFNIFVGIFNILPLYITDGGQIVKAITEKYAKKRSKQIEIIITSIILFMILYAIVGPYIRF
ncbi:MAG: hypothetical protein GTN40_02855 [Candidatus Aenigmarchaeota archaeon]|nr:hypothetical protein [Candidatus Aenigmarchaeota archaeon]